MTGEAKVGTSKFQCVVDNFHVGDGRVLYGPRKVDGEDVDGDIAEIPSDIAELGVKKKQGKIVK